MVNPQDPTALDELAALTDLEIEACVATESAIVKALQEMEGDLVEYVDDGSAAPVVAAPPVVVADWEALWSAPTVKPLLVWKTLSPSALSRANAITPFPTPATPDFLTQKSTRTITSPSSSLTT